MGDTIHVVIVIVVFIVVFTYLGISNSKKRKRELFNKLTPEEQRKWLKHLEETKSK